MKQFFAALVSLAVSAVSAQGVPIKIGNVTIAAVGVSGAPGGEKDEVCANAGIARVADQLK